jgi:ADP-heptose:LPS heptosyltransferase
MSLPRIFDTTLENIPANTPYITLDPSSMESWKKNMASDQSKLKVGIAWAGDPSYKKDYLHSLKLKDFIPLLQIKDVSFYQLQKESSADQEYSIEKELNLIDFTHLIEDFTDTAALIANLDLIISVDTSVTHLAGALGRPVWTLLPFVPDWRWMLEREDSPWYPTMRLFRQPSPGDWDSVMKRVVEELKLLI